MSNLSFSQVISSLPAYNCAQVEERYQAALSGLMHKLVVLDDDPTGVQTVHDVSVYTNWSLESLRAGFAESRRMFFLLTNSRSFSAERTAAVHREIGQRIVAAAQEPYLVVSRGDSTLRGHYPLETETLRHVLESAGHPHFDGEIICPFFQEGGRYTIQGVHYVRRDDHLIPVAETEFAQDQTFGFSSSRLDDWVAEKTDGEFPPDSSVHISLDTLRSLRYEEIEAALSSVTGFRKVLVDAVEDTDLKVFVTALIRAINRGKHFLFRTAASFVKILGGISDQPLLTGRQLIFSGKTACGLVVAGSHVKRSSEQLSRLSALPGVETVVFNQHLVLSGNAFQQEILRASKACHDGLRSGKTVLLMTRRDRFDVRTGDPEDELRVAVQISDALVEIVRNQATPPSFLIAKGGITSSDLGVKALGVVRAEVLGQIRPGVPVWRTDAACRFPGIPYIIFPGNVGDADDLCRCVKILCGEENS